MDLLWQVPRVNGGLGQLTRKPTIPKLLWRLVLGRTGVVKLLPKTIQLGLKLRVFCLELAVVDGQLLIGLQTLDRRLQLVHLDRRSDFDVKHQTVVLQ